MSRIYKIITISQIRSRIYRITTISQIIAAGWVYMLLQALKETVVRDRLIPNGA